MEQLLEFLKPVLELYGGKLGPVVQVLVFVGSLRVFLKPVVSFAKTYVEFTPSKGDNEKVAKVLDSKLYKSAAYLLDWFASLKLPQKK